MRALVLGGGGVTGIAWETGMLLGLEQAGVRLREADLIVGTSAGAAVGAQVAGTRTLGELFAAQLKGDASELPARISPLTLLRYLVAGLDPDRRRGLTRLGRQARAARTASPQARRSVIEKRIPVAEWPERRLLIPATDAESGVLRVFDRDSGVSLIDAVSASCAVPLVWPPVETDGHVYYDGGFPFAANVQLAAEADTVVVLAPVTAGIARGSSVAAQVEALGSGVRVVVVSPDRTAKATLGRNSLDPAARRASAEAGLAQAARSLADVAAVWA
jgi:NTE family protein